MKAFKCKLFLILQTRFYMGKKNIYILWWFDALSTFPEGSEIREEFFAGAAPGTVGGVPAMGGWIGMDLMSFPTQPILGFWDVLPREQGRISAVLREIQGEATAAAKLHCCWFKNSVFY